MRLCKFFILLIFTLIIVTPVFAQQGDSSDDKIFSSVELSSPQMPVINAPSVGGGFYVPKSPVNPAYAGGVMNQNSKKNDEKKDDSKSKEEKSNESAKSVSSSILTAQDLSALSGLGLFNSWGNINTNQSSDSAQKLLEQILEEAKNIKNQNAVLAEEYKKQNSSETPAADLIKPSEKKEVSSAETVVPKPKLLRFNVNGYDILRTCSKVYISSVQADGTFLVTGDRRYLSDGKLRTETFHILFKLQPGSSGLSNYTAAVNVTQDYLNEYSFVYQLSNKKNLSALRTGNLVTMRVNEPNWQLEFLIDLGEN